MYLSDRYFACTRIGTLRCANRYFPVLQDRYSPVRTWCESLGVNVSLAFRNQSPSARNRRIYRRVNRRDLAKRVSFTFSRINTDA